MNPNDAREAFEPSLRLALEGLQEGIALVGFDWRFLYANDTAARRKGCAPLDLLGRTIMEVNPGIEGTRTYEHLRRGLENRVPQRFEDAFPDGEGGTQWREVRVQPVPEGIFILSVDISSHRSAEQSLAQAAENLRTRLLHEDARLMEAHQALDASEARYRSIFEGMDEAYALFEIQRDGAGAFQGGSFLDVNPAFTAMTGMTREEVLGRLGREVLPDLSAPAIRTFGTLAVSGRPSRFAFPLPRLGLEIEGFAYSPSPGQMAVVFRDVKPRKTLERCLEEGNRLLDALMDFVPASITIARAPDGRISRISRYAQTLLRSDRTLEEQTIHGALARFAMYEPDGITAIQPGDLPLSRVMESGETILDEERVYRSASGGRWVLSCSAAPILSPEGSITGGISILLDITARKDAEERIRAQGALLAAINAVLRAALGSPSLDDVIERCLEVARQLTGSTLGFLETPGREGPAWLSALASSGQTLLLNPPPLASPGTGPAQPQSVRNLLVVPLRQGDGIVGSLALANKPTDFTEGDREMVELLSVAFVEALNRKQSDEAIQELNRSLARRAQEMEEAYQELDTFSYTVSHDLRAPLRHLTGFSGLLVREAGEGLSDKARGHLNHISEAALHMGRLVDELLAFARRGRTDLHLVPLDLDRLLSDTVAALEPQWRDRRIRWEIGTLGTLPGDVELMRTVFGNLLSNALKFTRDREVATIGVSCRQEGAERIFTFRDDGIGFDPQYQDKLFGVFQRLHAQSGFEGTGIGLANVRRIVKRHGGRVWAEGRPGLGAAFHFSLPS